MKKWMKKVAAVILTATMTIGIGEPVLAIEEASSLSEQASLIQNMSDKEFDAFIVEYVTSAQDSSKSISTIQRDLRELGVDFIPKDDGISPYFSSSDINLSSYAAKRYPDSFYRAYGQVTFHAKEGKPAKEDILAVGWDTSQASYHGYNEGDFANAREYDVNQGMFSFNIDDTKMSANSVAYGVVYVIPKTSASRLDIVATFLHTYNTASRVWSGTLNVSYDKTFSGDIEISVTSSSVGESTPYYADNTIYL